MPVDGQGHVSGWFVEECALKPGESKSAKGDRVDSGMYKTVDDHIPSDPGIEPKSYRCNHFGRLALPFPGEPVPLPVRAMPRCKTPLT